jgi:hypothetical protein
MTNLIYKYVLVYKFDNYEEQQPFLFELVFHLNLKIIKIKFHNL